MPLPIGIHYFVFPTVWILFDHGLVLTSARRLSIYHRLIPSVGSAAIGYWCGKLSQIGRSLTSFRSGNASLPVSDQMDASLPVSIIDVHLFLSNLYFFIADLLHSRLETCVPSFFFSPSKLVSAHPKKVPYFFSSLSSGDLESYVTEFGTDSSTLIRTR